MDYAHTPDALINVLNAIHDVLEGKGKVITVVGAGGNRDKGKRPIMAKEAAKASDRVIITSDNPRDEEPQAILDDIRTGIGKTEGAFVEIADRKEAIRYVIENRQPGDLVVLAGKGHETYQIRKGKRYEMDERVLIREILEESKGNV